MWNTTNPAEIYPNTTWELLPDNKFLKTGSTPLQQAGSNSIKLSKANLPAEKLQVESFSLTKGTMEITGTANLAGATAKSLDSIWTASTSGAFYANNNTLQIGSHVTNSIARGGLEFQASKNWTGSTSSASPYTSVMGSGTPIEVNPEHITVRAWKRLS